MSTSSPLGFISIRLFTFLCKAALEEEEEAAASFFKYVSHVLARYMASEKKKTKMHPTPQSATSSLFFYSCVCLCLVYLFTPASLICFLVLWTKVWRRRQRRRDAKVQILFCFVFFFHLVDVSTSVSFCNYLNYLFKVKENTVHFTVKNIKMK